MNQNHEQRADPRFNYKSPLKVKDLESGITFRARMVNYSKNGLSFETNQRLPIREEIYIGIERSPYTSRSFRSHESCHAKIIWCKKLTAGLFKYGYGVRYIFAGEKEISQNNDFKKRKDLRKDPRQSCSIPVLFATQKYFFKGLAQNISAKGAFIKTNHSLKTGQTLSLTIPLKGGLNAMIRGSVVWSNQVGFGAKFLTIKKNYYLQRNNNS
jgi:Tfp pilus assembly protein PilZ